MAFADELRKKSNEHQSTQNQEQIIEQKVSPIIKNCIHGLKELCVSEAKKGKSGISGFLSIGYEEYATTPSAYVSERNFEPFKNKDGIWCYSPGYSFDYGINGPVFDTSNEDRLKMANIVKNGILKGLYDCGFSHLSAEVITKPHYTNSFSSLSGRTKFSKSTTKLHFIHVSISWK